MSEGHTSPEDVLEPTREALEEAPLDAYSRVVTSVAAALLPSVASLRVGRAARRSGRETPEGAGTGVAITPDGFMLTSAHVVSGSRTGTASFTDGRELELEVIGTDRLSDLAVVRARGSGLSPAVLGDADPLGTGRVGDGGRRQRAWAVPAHESWQRLPNRRERDPDRRRPQSW
jgi:S1-C subfamily serine protease